MSGGLADRPIDRLAIHPPGSCWLSNTTRSGSQAQIRFHPALALPGVRSNHIACSEPPFRYPRRIAAFASFRPGSPRAKRKLRRAALKRKSRVVTAHVGGTDSRWGRPAAGRVRVGHAFLPLAGGRRTRRSAPPDVAAGDRGSCPGRGRDVGRQAGPARPVPDERGAARRRRSGRLSRRTRLSRPGTLSGSRSVHRAPAATTDGDWPDSADPCGSAPVAADQGRPP
jgi:hypothetical protein